ncbi:MAG: hypothetical protein MZV70_60295 [Desulfobacterales bacterium]|nr:hypothetical protein [Desulfobacterales bacterium]
MILASKAHHRPGCVCQAQERNALSRSLGNVYRNIAILLEEGRIQSGEFGSGIVRYDAVTASHYHFVSRALWHGQRLRHARLGRHHGGRTPLYTASH